MKEASVVLVSLAQADGQTKVRPALVLRTMPPFNDLLVCGISSQLHHESKGFDEVIKKTDADFSTSGLRSSSLIRLGFLAVVPTQSVAGSIGAIDSNRHQMLLKRLATYLVQNVP